MFEKSIFGNIFDFDGDGKVDLSEEIVGFGILHEMEKEENSENDLGFGFNDDLDDFNF